MIDEHPEEHFIFLCERNILEAGLHPLCDASVYLNLCIYI